jgi:hypothetical protein
MIEEFVDEPARGYSAHSALQQWRRQHPDGFFLAFKTRVKANMHLTFGCHHNGGGDWQASEEEGSLTTHRKVCSDGLPDLIRWASDNGVEWRWCSHCKDGAAVALPQPGSPVAQPSSTKVKTLAPSYTGMTTSVVEGIAREVTIMAHSRSRELRAVALERSGGVCEACCVDFSEVLGGMGVRALQVHHRNQLALLDEPVINRVSDVAVVCANCHAMIHADPVNAMPVERLRAMLGDAT